VSPGSSGSGGGAGGRGCGLDLAPPDVFGDADIPAGFDAGAASGDNAVDGRRARGQRTRRNVAEALTVLLRAGNPDPTARAVATRAGVSLRLVFHHFADMDDLYHYLATLQLRRQWSAMPRISPKLSRATRIERTVSHRAALFEEISPVRRALVRRAPSSPRVRASIGAADRLLLENLEVTFAPELAVLPAGSRAEYLGAMDTAASWEAWEHLRTSSGTTVRAAKRVVTRVLSSLNGLGAESGPGLGAPVAAPNAASS
jgi:TetR/AcrR family transcriptional regulator, regulator of autoinduction and epiphytic fitness